MASSEPSATAGGADADAEKKKSETEVAKAQREAFLRRLEMQQKQNHQEQEQQLKSPPEDEIDANKEEVGETNIGKEKVCQKPAAKQEEGRKQESPPKMEDTPILLSTEGKKALDAILNNETTGKISQVQDSKKSSPATQSKKMDDSTPPPLPPNDAKSPTNSKKMSSGNEEAKLPSKTPTGDQLLINYLSKYCDNSSSATSPTSCASNPSDWIQDVDPSSLAYLKSLAGINEPTPNTNPPFQPGVALFNTTTTQTNNPFLPNNNNFYNRAESAYSIASSSNNQGGESVFPPPMKPGDDPINPGEPTKTWEINVPPGIQPGEPFLLKANGKCVRVACPQNAKVGSKIRFKLPLSLTGEKAQGSSEEGQFPPYYPPPPPYYVPPPPGMMMQSTNFGVPYNNMQSMMNPGRSNTLVGDSALGSGLKSNNSIQAASQIMSAASTNSGGKKAPAEDGESSLQHRMLDLIERQQRQMQEMQARIDALGGMMASMEQDMRHLRFSSQQQSARYPPYNQRNATAAGGGAPVQGYRIFGGLFGGGGTTTTTTTTAQQGQQEQRPIPNQQGILQWQDLQMPTNQGVTTYTMEDNLPQAIVMPGQGQQQQSGTRNAVPPPPPFPPLPGAGGPQPPPVPSPTHQRPQAPQQQQQQPPAPPLVPPPQQYDQDPRARPVPEVIIGEHPPPVNQGIVFPLFVMLFRFIFSIPQRVRSLLLSTGPGRIYAHLRQRAIDRRAFANIDLSSIMKLLVMLLIFTGRVGRNEGNQRNRQNNNNNNNNHQDAEDGMIAYAYSLARQVMDYWNGHRVHTLILASVIAFLIQVGLMSFMYEVLWVERAELWRAWWGQDDNEDGDNNENDALAAADGGNQNAAGDGNNNNNQAAAARPQNIPGGNAQRQAPAAAAAPVQPGAAPGGMIRRGPNGGFFHDIQCLILSFLLSLIPAWRPEAAAQDPEPELIEENAQQQPEAAAAAQVEGEGQQQTDGPQEQEDAEERPFNTQGGDDDDGAIEDLVAE